MSVHQTASRPAGASAGAVTLGLVLTLATFVMVFLAFLLAPILLLGVALVAYLVMRPRPGTAAADHQPVQLVQPPNRTHRFGAGAP